MNKQQPEYIIFGPPGSYYTECGQFSNAIADAKKYKDKAEAQIIALRVAINSQVIEYPEASA